MALSNEAIEQLRKQHLRTTYGSKLATAHGEIVAYERAIKKLTKKRESLVMKLAEIGVSSISIATLSGMDLETVIDILGE